MSSPPTLKEKHWISECQKIMKKCSPKSLNMTSSPTPIKEHSYSEWQNTLKNVLPGVMRLYAITPIAFDYQEPRISTATSFVVDKSRGIAVTNRHCVRLGPASFCLRFINGEEIWAERIYVDPIHDFAFLKFDPSAIKYMKVTEIELDPNGATVGLDVRVIGNDSGEFFTPIKGVIIETHDIGRYKDWNITYILTCLVTRGGCSGSPMINIRGKALGIVANSNHVNLGGTVRLERVVRALEYLKKGFIKDIFGDWRWTPVKVPRKTLFANFCSVNIDILIENGLLADEEKFTTFGNREDFVAVQTVLPGCELALSDIILSIDGIDIYDIDTLESIVDDIALPYTEVTVLRRFVTPKKVQSWVKSTIQVHVVDLNSQIPDFILDICGSSIHPSSPFLSFTHKLRVGTTIVSTPGDLYRDMQMPSQTKVITINRMPFQNYIDFLRMAIESLDVGQCLLIQTSEGFFYIDEDDYQKIYEVSCWTLLQNEKGYTWTKHDVRDMTTTTYLRPSQPEKKIHNQFLFRNNLIHLRRDDLSPQQVLERSLVNVWCRWPSAMGALNGCGEGLFRGIGVVVHHSISSNKGLILVQNIAAPVIAGSVTIFFCYKRLRVEGTVVFEDSVKGFSLISYHPCDLYEESMNIMTVNIYPLSIMKNEIINAVTLDHNNCYESRSSVVTSAQNNYHSQFVKVQSQHETPLDAAIVADESFRLRGMCVATYENCLHVISIHHICETLGRLISCFSGEMTQTTGILSSINEVINSNTSVPTINASFNVISIKEAISYGLPDLIIKRVGYQREFLQVNHCFPGDFVHALQQDDIILAINNKSVTCKGDLDYLTWETSLIVWILRDGCVLRIPVGTYFEEQKRKIRVIRWCGGIVQEIPQRMKLKGFYPGGVFVTISNMGGPLTSIVRPPFSWITHINGKKIKDMKQFEKCIKLLKDGEVISIRVVSEFGNTYILPLKMDLFHFPTLEFTLDQEMRFMTKSILNNFDL